MRTISSQTYRHHSIIAEKRAAADYEVLFVDVEVDGEEYRVVVDGHHSHAAAKADGVEPQWTRARELQRDANIMGAPSFLSDFQMDSDWHDIDTGYPVF